MTYDSLIHDLISTQLDILGTNAVDIANEVDGLTVAEDGTVEEISGDGLAVTRKLVSSYVDRLGPAAKVSLENAAETYADELELPRNLE